MRKRWKAREGAMLIMLIACLYAIVAGISFLYAFGFKFPIFAVPVTVDELNGRPSFWVGKKVLVEGKIYLIYFPQGDVPPYNYGLQSAHASFGVLWKNLNYEGENVVVMGIVKYYSSVGIDGTYSGYYIEAETVIKT